MKTAESFLREGVTDYDIDIIVNNLTSEQIIEAMIEFAKHHVEKALREAALNADTSHVGMGLVIVDTETIINAYPLTNIK